ncbi:Retrovirus-related Pol polyprotein from transposon [Smittium culicis]|uniref:Retrovirus-related Pol polyprotein from transposon n=1 Tax=Smittium culicis TaxID=133412 RepID=A0A1R1XXF1_9FUNG|nr:Retrovirus-related Pol polyprotein from transposon [Smittium culicis]
MEALTDDVLLSHPNFENEFILSTGVSSVVVGAVLVQVGENGINLPIAYYSRKLLPAEKNYAAFEKEGLAVVSAVKNFRPYLWGNHFAILTDNTAVASVYRNKEPT